MKNSIVVKLAAGLGLATVIFAVITFIRFRDFSAYNNAHALQPWHTQPLDIAACLDWTIDYATHCEGLHTLCQVHSDRLMQECLQSADRTEYCQQIGSQVQTTGFGFGDCETRWQKETTRRLQKKTDNVCAAFYRIIAEHCRALGHHG